MADSKLPSPSLTPPELLEQIKRDASNGNTLPSVQQTLDKPKEPVLPTAHAGSPEENGAGGLLGTAVVPKRRRKTSRKQKKVPNPVKRRSGTLEANISKLLRQLVAEQNPEEDEGVTYADTIAHQILKAAGSGHQWAIEYIRDSLEGKPGRAPAKSTDQQDVEEAIDQIEVSLLNKFAEDTDA